MYIVELRHKNSMMGIPCRRPDISSHQGGEIYRLRQLFSAGLEGIHPQLQEFNKGFDFK
jgi:hypothetical protein